MTKYDCIAVCVLGVAVALTLSVLAITVPLQKSFDAFTEAISDPGVPTHVEIQHMIITNGEGITVEIDEFESNVDSRLIDIWLGAAATNGY